MRSFIVVTLLLLALFGCSERTALQHLLGSWVGANETQLVKHWGQPDKTISQGHTRYLLYSKSGPARTAGQDSSIVAVSDCLITFESLDEIIVSSRYEGAGCGAY
jgi:hypothetical protein